MSKSLICSSLVLSSTWKAVESLRAWPRRSGAYRDLHPLWYAIYQVVPSIALAPPRRPERPRRAWFGADSRLYRRFVEIGDGLLMLGDLDEQLIDQVRRRAEAEGWEPERARAAGEAAAVLGAIERRRQGGSAESGRSPQLEKPTDLGTHADLDADARRLGMISAALDTDVVRQGAALRSA
ncbi:DUF6545 domain-containing protein [Micromonospora yangpuensis]|uniref:DUF6545 domain-containing protein n=1 Tax=Micromonospora yangpuensis TaxID=683228 RepID=UPI000B87A58C|nr:DUF6545 domain-containing protein [Micromonospora yangpuensis]GGM25327.1 hypothetical protein GCM10012279_49710 [Micromonospora yangpuensis]